MRLCTSDQREEFDATIVTDHPASIPGPIALQRQDTHTYISLGDCFGIPGRTSFQKYQIIDISDEEIGRLDKEGEIRVVALDPADLDSCPRV